MDSKFNSGLENELIITLSIHKTVFQMAAKGSAYYFEVLVV